MRGSVRRSVAIVYGALAHEDSTSASDDPVARGEWASSGRRVLEFQATRQSEYVREP